MTRTRLAAAIVTIAALAVFAMMWKPAPRRSDAASVTSSSTAAAVPAPTTTTLATSRLPIAAPDSVSTAREDSLRGTTVDGAVHLDAQGRPIADRDLRRLYDYFLARLGERTPAQIRDDLLAHLRDALHLDAAAQTSVLAWFDAYTATERAGTALPRSGDLAVDLERLHALHRDQLGADLADAWYGSDDAYADHTATRLALEHDVSLSATERDARREALDKELDPSQRDVQHATTDFQFAVAQSEQFEAERIDTTLRHDERAALWGEDAAKRLDALDQADAAWQQRLQSYANARDALLGDAALSAPQRDQRLGHLLDGFSEPERRRVLALADAGLLPRR